MTFEDFKNLDFLPFMPLEQVLVELLYKRQLDVNAILSAYAHAIERDRTENRMRFEEACICLTQHLSGNYKGSDKDKLTKRMISILNKSTTVPRHIWDEKYGYTEKDEKEWEEFYDTIYGKNIEL